MNREQEFTDVSARVVELESELAVARGRIVVLEADRANLLVAAANRRIDLEGAVEGAIELLEVCQEQTTGCIGGRGCGGYRAAAIHMPACRYARLLEALARVRATPPPSTR